jgi:hypothetical protein
LTIALPVAVAAVDEVDGAAAEAGVLALEFELDELPHPATITAAVASAATAATRNLPVLRLVIIRSKFVVSWIPPRF